MTETQNTDPSNDTNELHFTVAAALLRELGERLVGRPHIALAELIKNAYDADAKHVRIEFRPNAIIVADDGQGMTFKEFENFWMRIGTPHKQNERLSRTLRRPLTGSKGVGRLAVQFLARKVEIRTVVERGKTLVASVDWEQTVQHDLLTEASAQWHWTDKLPSLPESSLQGTHILLSGLNQEWEDEAFRDLARELWMLQPPFPVVGDEKDANSGLQIDFRSSRPTAKEFFDGQMNAVERDWIARIQGDIIPSDQPDGPLKGRVRVSFTHRSLASVLKFEDRRTVECYYEVVRNEVTMSGEKHTETAKASDLAQARYDIRVYNLSNRQPEGIKLEDLRRYLKEFGGVHIYDGGFRLPFYGGDTDWLNIEKDHSHRKDVSALLPKELQARNGLNDLPTNERIFGMVLVDTGKERQNVLDARGQDSDQEELLEEENPERIAPEYLTLSVTRDRLLDNRAFAALRDFVRFGVDFYATETARRKYAEASKRAATVKPSLEDIRDFDRILDEFRADIPEPAVRAIKAQVRRIEIARESETTLETQRAGLLGALATAGITAIAYEHEVSKQLHRVEGIIERVEALHTGIEATDMELAGLGRELRDYLARTRAVRALFTNVMNEENRKERLRFRAKALIESTIQQMGILLRSTRVDTNLIDEDLRLPVGNYAEWSALFQNVLMNAVNAMLDSTDKRISIISLERGKKRDILIQDTGSGVNLSEAEKLFEPFERRQNVSPEHVDLGYGGTGLGLTIVRMIATNVGCNVAFIVPEPDFSTAFHLSWEEA